MLPSATPSELVLWIVDRRRLPHGSVRRHGFYNSPVASPWTSPVSSIHCLDFRTQSGEFDEIFVTEIFVPCSPVHRSCLPRVRSLADYGWIVICGIGNLQFHTQFHRR